MKPGRGKDTVLAKAARLAILLELDAAGLLEGKSAQVIADALGGDVDRTTIWRDKKLLAEVRRRRDEAKKKLRI